MSFEIFPTSGPQTEETEQKKIEEKKAEQKEPEEKAEKELTPEERENLILQNIARLKSLYLEQKALFKKQSKVDKEFNKLPQDRITERSGKD